MIKIKNEKASEEYRWQETKDEMINILNDSIGKVDLKIRALTRKIKKEKKEVEELERLELIVIDNIDKKIEKSSFINNKIIKRAYKVDNLFKLIELSRWLGSKNLKESDKIINLLF